MAWDVVTSVLAPQGRKTILYWQITFKNPANGTWYHDFHCHLFLLCALVFYSSYLGKRWDPLMSLVISKCICNFSYIFRQNLHLLEPCFQNNSAECLVLPCWTRLCEPLGLHWTFSMTILSWGSRGKAKRGFFSPFPQGPKIGPLSFQSLCRWKGSW